MSAAELVRRLAHAGVRLMPHGDRLRVDALRGLLSPDEWTTLAARKGEILALLRDTLVTDEDQARAPVKQERPVESPSEAGADLVAIACAMLHCDPVAVQVRSLPPDRSSLRCYFCRSATFWQSTSGVVRCARCYPPAAPHLVAGRLGAPTGGPGSR